MQVDMTSKRTTIWLALFFGFSNAVSKGFSGYPIDRMPVYFLGGAIAGTLLVLSVVWVVMAVLGKWHLHIIVSNWMLLIVGCLGALQPLLV